MSQEVRSQCQVSEAALWWGDCGQDRADAVQRLPSFLAVCRTPLGSPPVSVPRDIQAMALIAQVGQIGRPGPHSGVLGVADPSTFFSPLSPACFSPLSLEVDPCAAGHGGCSPHANCTKVAPGQRTCTCQDGYTGDGELCQGEAPQDRHM